MGVQHSRLQPHLQPHLQPIDDPLEKAKKTKTIIQNIGEHCDTLAPSYERCMSHKCDKFSDCMKCEDCPCDEDDYDYFTINYDRFNRLCTTCQKDVQQYKECRQTFTKFSRTYESERKAVGIFNDKLERHDARPPLRIKNARTSEQYRKDKATLILTNLLYYHIHDRLDLSNEADNKYLDTTNIKLNNKFFQGSNLSGMDFSNSDLSGSNFSRCILKGTNFNGADLRDCDFRGATLDNADIRGSNTRGAIFDKDVDKSNVFGYHFSKTKKKSTRKKSIRKRK